MKNRLFNLSFITDEVSQDLDEILSFAKKFEIDALEIRTIMNKGFPDLLEEKQRLKKFLEDNNMKISAIASPTFKCDIDSQEEYEAHIRIFRSCAELANYLNVNLVRAFTFWKKGKYEENKDKIVEKFEKIIDIADQYGLTIVVENEPSTFVGNGRTLSDFLNTLKVKNVRALWDPGNELMDEENENSYPEGFNYVKDYIAHVHIKDGIKENGKVRFLRVGNGIAKIKENLIGLLEIGYRGYISLETHWRMKKELKEESIRKPGGKEFSSGAYEASEESMRGLLEIIEQIERNFKK